MGGNVEILLGQDVLNLHPERLVEIHDGFYITKMRARLHNDNQYLGFSGLFPRGLEPYYREEDHPKAMLYADNPEQADHESEQVFWVAASAHHPW